MLGTWNQPRSSARAMCTLNTQAMSPVSKIYYIILLKLCVRAHVRVHVSVCRCPGRQKEGVGFPGGRITGSYEMSCGCWELSSVSLQVQCRLKP